MDSKYKIGDIVGIYGYETDVKIWDIRQEGDTYSYLVSLADGDEWIYDDDIAYKKDNGVDYRTRKCGGCRGFMRWCKKRRSTNSCDKPACERFEPRQLEDFVIIGQPITGM